MKKCKKCGKCCKRFEINVDLEAEKNKPIIAAVLQKLFRDTGEVKLKKLDRMAIAIYGDCVHLNDQNECRIYPKRPKMCQNYLCEDIRKV